ncbi:hypothetical protein BPO_p0081 (plasmid) [Bergeyella porcorum]|uniref:Uncharacterized protein n=1 Tax=Bergeyella porcorum TaxID=1735111 RepID=A0AAU0F4J6_9FLAO
MKSYLGYYSEALEHFKEGIAFLSHWLVIKTWIKTLYMTIEKATITVFIKQWSAIEISGIPKKLIL